MTRHGHSGAFRLLLPAAALLLARPVSGEVLIARDATWQYHPGTSEASDPRSAWRSIEFDDSTWLSGQAPIGYGDEPRIHTVLADMRDSYTTFFVRRTFTVTQLDADTRLNALVDYDDGFILWLNGARVLAGDEPDGTPLHDSVASGNHESGVFEAHDLGRASEFVEPGLNVAAVQVFNSRPGSGDCEFNLELATVLRVADTTFSHDRGFYDAAFTCTISTATPGATIRYTLNGSDPRAATAGAYTIPAPSGTVGIDPDSETGRLVNGGKAPCVVLRAYALKAGYEPTNVDTHTYLFAQRARTQPNVMDGEDWIPGDNPHGYTVKRPAARMNTELDPDVVDDPRYTGLIEAALKAVPTLCIAADYADIFGNSRGIFHNSYNYGIEWERPVSAELIHPDGTEGFHVNCGIRASGGVSRTAEYKAKLSMSLRFRGEYGPGKLRYTLFPDAGIDAFDSLRLRAHFHDGLNRGECAGTQLRDAWARATQREMGWLSPHSGWAHVYINGFYWGLYSPTELPTADYMEAHLGGDEADYDVVANANGHRIPHDDTYPRLIDGTHDAWSAMTNLTHLADPAQYDLMHAYLNVTGYVDYCILQMYGCNYDWNGTNAWDTLGTRTANWRAGRRSRNRGPGDTGFSHFIWDFEWTMGAMSTAREYVDRTWVPGPENLHERMLANPDYKALFADRAYRHFFNGGALTPEAGSARWRELMQRIELAVVAESARWGDTWLNTPQTRDDHWMPNNAYVLNTWFPQRTAIVLSQFRSRGLYPSLDAPAFHRHGGAIGAGFKLTLSNPNTTGTVYYTLDGVDPRESGGGRHAAALRYAGSVPLSRTTRVKARVWKTDATWSALHEATYNYTAHYANIRITELLYNPLGGSDCEFIELANTGSAPRGLSGMRFAGITYAFAPGTELPGGAHLVLARNAGVFARRYGFAPYGQYGGKLDNGGERIALLDCEGRTVTGVRYDDRAPWPKAADGDGFALVFDGSGEQDDPAKWRAGNLIGGSPGRADGPACRVVISEALTHSDPPQVDAIELYNAGTADVDIGGWYLSDSETAYRKFRIPAPTWLRAGEYAVFDEHDFNPSPGDPACFALDSHGDQVCLTQWDANGNLVYLEAVRFGAAENGRAFARHVKTRGGTDFAPQSAPATLGAANAYPLVGPVVINEIMYHPADAAYEFVELFNTGTQMAKLYDPAEPSNGWRFAGAFDYAFPPGSELAPGEHVLIVPTNASAFRAAYPDMPAATRIFGPYAGRLGNDGEELRLLRPDTPDAQGVPYILVDCVDYGDNSPWPESADGQGPALERIAGTLHGNDSANWSASRLAGGTPGRANSGVLVSKTAGWQYWDRGSEIDPQWNLSSFSDRSWADGNAPLGYPAADLDLAIDTELDYGGNPAAKHMTAWFRKAFLSDADPAHVAELLLTAKYDDGFVAYLNGHEIARGGMPTGPIDAYTPAAAHNGSQGAYATFDLAAHIGALLQGVNVLAVEVHQNAPTSSDLVLDMQLARGAAPHGYDPPAAPSGLSAAAVSATAVELTWQDNSTNEEDFKLRWGMTAAEQPNAVMLAPDTTAYRHTGLTPNTVYYYRLQAEHATLGDSAYTPILSATTAVGSTPGTIEVRIAAGADDIEQPQDGTMDFDSTDLEMTEDGDRVQLVGLRFAGVGIPAGASITAAYVQFETDETGSAATSLKIGGEAAADARPFSTAAYDAGGRPRTAASVAWNPAAWTSVGPAGAAQRTPDLSAVIQEIVDLPGWQTGNALVLLVSGSGKRVARAYEGDPSGAALLHVEFNSMPGDGDADGVADTWEQAQFGSTSSPDSAPEADPDGDGYSNLQEFVAGTGPKSA
ncbi:MAG: lamin tail domain-containing protein, partial [Kiritimatiellae bacterium]|nr:lamin tail domain-containing protein [Kiritimatiellia bacterium]